MAKIIFEKNLEIPMRDGCVLRGDLFRPDGPEKLPVIINRTPYNKAMPMVFALTMDSLRAASAGITMSQDGARLREQLGTETSQRAVDFQVLFVDCNRFGAHRAKQPVSIEREIRLQHTTHAIDCPCEVDRGR